jgi:hypothetical protein
MGRLRSAIVNKLNITQQSNIKDTSSRENHYQGGPHVKEEETPIPTDVQISIETSEL